MVESLAAIYADITIEMREMGLPFCDVVELRKVRELSVIGQAVESLAESVSELASATTDRVFAEDRKTDAVVPLVQGLLTAIQSPYGNASDLLAAADRLATDIGEKIVDLVPEAAAAEPSTKKS